VTKPLPAAILVSIILAMMMLYTVVLLRLGLSVTATAGLATTLGAVSMKVACRATQQTLSRPRLTAQDPAPTGDAPAEPTRAG